MPTYRCPAKVNLALSVGSPRPSDGYHPICSWMVQVTLFDDLVVGHTGDAGAADTASTFDITWAGDAPQRSPIDWPIEKDLVFKAHRLVEEYAGRKLPVKVSLRKRIPVGAGLAGGSTDGAMMLRALNDIFALDLPRPTMTQLAGKLGSDLPFFLHHRSAIVGGVGEVVEPMPLPASGVHLTLILSELHCNTAAVYRKFDELVKEHAVEEWRVRSLAIMDPAPADGPFNDLADPAMHVEPRLRMLRDALVKKLGRPVHVTGSGAAMFIVARDLDDARRLEATVRDAGVPAMAVQAIA